MTYDEFIAEHGLKFEAVRVGSRLFSDGDEWSKKAVHWYCTLTNKDGGLFGTFYSYSQGGAKKKGLVVPPTFAEVLDSLDSDCAGVANGETFEQWASDNGHDEDSRRAGKLYHTIRETCARFRHWLGDEAFNQLLNDVERL